jgi:hypothetical protein
MALRERLAAEKDLMAERLPDARLLDSLSDEGGIAGLCGGTLPGELAEDPVGLHPRRRGLLSDHRPIAAPRPVARLRDHRGAHGIEHHIARQLQQIGIPLHQDGLEPTLEEMTHQPMAAIARLGVDAVELTHPLGEVRIGRLDDEVIVVGHLAPGVAAPVETAAHLAQHDEPVRAVLIVAIDRLAPITARGHMVQPASELDAEGSGHDAQSSSEMLDCKT